MCSWPRRLSNVIWLNCILWLQYVNLVDFLDLVHHKRDCRDITGRNEYYHTLSWILYNHTNHLQKLPWNSENRSMTKLMTSNYTMQDIDFKEKGRFQNCIELLLSSFWNPAMHFTTLAYSSSKRCSAYSEFSLCYFSPFYFLSNRPDIYYRISQHIRVYHFYCLQATKVLNLILNMGDFY